MSRIDRCQTICRGEVTFSRGGPINPAVYSTNESTGILMSSVVISGDLRGDLKVAEACGRSGKRAAMIIVGNILGDSNVCVFEAPSVSLCHLQKSPSAGFTIKVALWMRPIEALFLRPQIIICELDYWLSRDSVSSRAPSCTRQHQQEEAETYALHLSLLPDLCQSPPCRGLL